MPVMPVPCATMKNVTEIQLSDMHCRIKGFRVFINKVYNFRIRALTEFT